MINCFEMPAMVDAMSASMMEKEIASMQITGGCLSFDASHVEYIAGAGLRLMRNLERSGVCVRVYGANADVRELFDAAGLGQQISRLPILSRAAERLHSLFARPVAAHMARPVNA